MRVRNAHPGALADLAPGDVGEVDEKNVAVAAWLSAGMLVEEKAWKGEPTVVPLSTLQDVADDIDAKSDNKKRKA